MLEISSLLEQLTVRDLSRLEAGFGLSRTMVDIVRNTAPCLSGR
jgi:hypothetical protein